MNPALLKALLALAPVLVLIAGAALLFSRDKRNSSLLQLLGASCLAVVVLTHICEALQLFPGLQWGEEHSIGHYIDLAAALLGLTLFPIGYLLHTVRTKRHHHCHEEH